MLQLNPAHRDHRETTGHGTRGQAMGAVRAFRGSGTRKQLTGYNNGNNVQLTNMAADCKLQDMVTGYESRLRDKETGRGSSLQVTIMGRRT